MEPYGDILENKRTKKQN